jgi:hypothetical protein
MMPKTGIAIVALATLMVTTEVAPALALGDGPCAGCSKGGGNDEDRVKGGDPHPRDQRAAMARNQSVPSRTEGSKDAQRASLAKDADPRGGSGVTGGDRGL